MSCISFSPGSRTPPGALPPPTNTKPKIFTIVPQPVACTCDAHSFSRLLSGPGGPCPVHRLPVNVSPTKRRTFIVLPQALTCADSSTGLPGAMAGTYPLHSSAKAHSPSETPEFVPLPPLSPASPRTRSPQSRSRIARRFPGAFEYTRSAVCALSVLCPARNGAGVPCCTHPPMKPYSQGRHDNATDTHAKRQCLEHDVTLAHLGGIVKSSKILFWDQKGRPQVTPSLRLRCCPFDIRSAHWTYIQRGVRVYPKKLRIVDPKLEECESNV